MAKKNDTVPAGTDNFRVTKLMVSTLISTSVRIFLPTLGLFAIGAIIDFSFSYKPYGMIIGAAVGIIVSAILVFMQIRAIKLEDK